MYFKEASPESVGISSKRVLDFIKTLDSYGFCTHDMIMSRGDKIFAEMYYAPFHKDYKHRMYSVSKSFVSIALGTAMEEGLVSLDDKLTDYFEEYVTDQTPTLIKETTIKDMLVMETSISEGIDWFSTVKDDRCKLYFETNPTKVNGTLFHYDSPASFMLGAIVEKVTGKPFLEYLKEKALCEIGFSKDAYSLKAPGGYSWGDSAVMCTARDLLIFARFVMNKGEWLGKKYMKSSFIEDAVKRQVCNNLNGHMGGYGGYGYGYQIWKAPRDGFAFVGMGDQFAICDTETDFIFIINSDNQGNNATRPILYHELYKSIIPNLGEPMPEDESSLAELKKYMANAKLFALEEERDNPFIKDINDKTYILDENPMNIEYIKLSFEEKKGTLCYKNKQGEKELVFGIGYNEFGKFPEEGYSDEVGTVFAPGNFYECAASADWAEDKKLRIKVQIIDKYFGNGLFVLSFKDDRVTLSMISTAEAFMLEYRGIATGIKIKQ